VPFPSPPWSLRGQLWLSVFAVASDPTTGRRPGLYGVGFADYQEGSVLTYRELLVARLVHPGRLPRGRVAGATITDIWVDSAASRAGARSLWAIPKQDAEFRVEDHRTGALRRTTAGARVGDRLLAAAAFTAGPTVAPRLPFRLSVVQTRADGSPVVAAVTGSARCTPCTAGWHLARGGTLAWLHGRRPLISLRLSGFRISFGD
jgi:hypothetical protein